MKLTPLFILVPLAVAFVISCSISDKDRCGKGYEYRDIDGGASSCFKVDTGGTDLDSDSDSDSDGDADSGVDGAVDGGDDLPTCLYQTCTADVGCPGCEADYCGVFPGDTEGQCTIQNCTVSPNDCPDGLICCDTPATFGIPNICISQAYYDQINGDLMCQG
jgi:hypothetical protein